MFIAMNNFKVARGREADFEAQWRGRQTYLQDVPGFVEFALLKSDTEGEYISHTVWRDRESFDAWTQSPAFAAGHRQGSVGGLLDGHPVLKLCEAVLVERADATAGSRQPAVGG